MAKLRGGMAMKQTNDTADLFSESILVRIVQSLGIDDVQTMKEKIAEQQKEIIQLQNRLKKLQELKKQRDEKKAKKEVKTSVETEAIANPVPEEKRKLQTDHAKAYLDQINHITQKEGYDLGRIMQVLPTKDTVNFDTIMNELILEIQKQYSFYTVFALETRPSKEDTLSEENATQLSNMEDLRDMLIEHQNEKNELSSTAEPFKENTPKATLIPLLSANGNNLLIGDLKSFTQEQYPYILRLLNELEQGDLKHAKQLSNNSDLNGYCELRDLRHYIRILYKSLGDNQYAILGLFYKNTDNIKGLMNRMKLRVNTFEGQKDKIEKMLHNQNPDFITYTKQNLHDLKTRLGGEDDTYENARVYIR